MNIPRGEPKIGRAKGADLAADLHAECGDFVAHALPHFDGPIVVSKPRTLLKLPRTHLTPLEIVVFLANLPDATYSRAYCDTASRRERSGSRLGTPRTDGNQRPEIRYLGYGPRG